MAAIREILIALFFTKNTKKPTFILIKYFTNN